MKKIASALALVAGLVAAPAQAGELFGGVYAHGVDTPFTFETNEEGVDFQVGVRTEPLEVLSIIGKPSPYVFASLNSAGDTSFVAAGLSWKLAVGPVYVRPGVGLALHNAPDLRVDPETRLRTDLGSRLLLEPEIAVGTKIGPNLSLEASWVHISNARLFNREQNPGIDMLGLRLNKRI
ncbi:MAG: acyloxyacyl hydrolase [Qipengyuania sp.]